MSAALRIFGLLPTLTPYGGVLSVVNAMNILVDQGHHVTLASFSEIGTDQLHARTEPIHVEMDEPLPQRLAASHDVFIATSWETAEPIADLAQHNDDAATFYYIQDYEADFYPAGAEEREEVAETYRMIDNKIVKTRHLQDRLAADGFAADRIPPGMDLDIFYPRAGLPSTREPGVLAMARPDTLNDHRGFDILTDVYAELARRRPGLRLEVFGPTELPSDFAGENHGRVPPSKLPELYSSFPVLVDVSRTHGFGRTGVEAMACGTAVVLSNSGGISEYAVANDNALIVPVGDAAETVAAIERLLDTPELADRLTERGLETVAGYSDYLAAEELERLLRAGR